MRRSALCAIAAATLALYACTRCTVGCGSELHDLISCKSDLTADLYEGHELLRTHGNVYVIYSGDTVKAVAWQFYLLPYIDT